MGSGLGRLRALGSRLSSARFPGAGPTDIDETELADQQWRDLPSGPSIEAAAYSTGAVEVRLHRAAQARRDAQLHREMDRERLSPEHLRSRRLLVPSYWEGSLLDPAPEGEEPGCSEAEAKSAAHATLQQQQFEMAMAGDHLTYCRYTFGAAKRQPAWVGLVGREDVLVVINANNARVLELRQVP